MAAQTLLIIPTNRNVHDLTGRPAERFWTKVNKQGAIPACCPELGPCWEWLASKTTNGYGKFWNGERLEPAHRFSYRLVHGEIREETLDHLCRNRGCVNPEHVEPVSKVVNVMRGEGFAAQNARKTNCPAGHSYRGKNLRVNPKTGYRSCRTCTSRRSKEENARRPKKGLFRKFSPRQVVRLRQLHGSGHFTQAALAVKFRMSRAMVCLIVNHKLRKDG